MTLKVLVIDDDEQIRNFMTTVLEREGHRVVTATDGLGGTRLQREDPADVVFCDLFMPEQEGLETIRILLREQPRLPIVAMSGGTLLSDMDFLPIAERLGAVCTLPKPLRRDRILAAVDVATAGRP
jgi:CheY-like chemotaxis protein